MLIRFAVENFRSINEEIGLSLVAMDKSFPASREAPDLGESLTTVAGIFGPNASGKSNILAAIQWLKDAVYRSLRYWDDEIPLDQFRFNSKHERATEFQIEFLIDGIRFEYQLEVGTGEVIYEGLFHYPLGRRKRIFERNRLELTFQDGLGVLAGSRQLLTSRSLVLSIARRFNEKLTSSFAQKILEINAQGLTRHRTLGQRSLAYSARRLHSRWYLVPDRDDYTYDADDDYVFDESEFDLAVVRRKKGLALLKMADLGIVDVFDVVAQEDIASAAARATVRKIKFMHAVGDDLHAFDIFDESAGTLTWFYLIGPVLTALDRGSLLIFDEIDASLHPKLSAALLSLFANLETNPKHAQIVFTSHDASLLAGMNRDQVWFTDKNRLGATELTPLTDFGGDRVRKSQNLEKGYLDGRFGGVPDVDLISFFRATDLLG